MAPSPPLAVNVTGRLVVARTLQGLLMHVLLKARGFIVIPVYARLLDPAGLGALTLAGATCGLLAPVIILGLHTGLSVQLVHVKDREAIARAFASIVRLAGTTAMLGSLGLVLLLTRPGTPPFLMPLRPYALALGLLLLTTSLRDIALTVPQLRQETGYLMALNLGIDYGGALLAVILVWRGWGPAGIFWATGGALGVGIFLALARTFRQLGPPFGLDRSFLLSALAVGLPVLPISLGQWVLQALDNLFLAAYHGESVVGIYGLAYSLASVVMLVLAALNLVYFPTAVALWHEGADRLTVFLNRSFRLVGVALGVFVSGAFLVGPWGVVFLVGSRYADAGTILPVIVLAYAAFTISQLLQFVPMVVERRTGAIAICYVVMTLLNVALNFLLIPRWAMKGAALATLLSYLAGVLLMGRLARAALPGFRWWQPFAATSLPLGVGTVAALIFQVRPSAPVWEALASVLLLVAGYVALARGSGALTPEDWALLRATARTGGGPAAPS